MLKLSLLLVAFLLLVPDSSDQLFGTGFANTAEVSDDINSPPFEAGMEIPQGQKQTHLNGSPIIQILEDMILDAIDNRNNMGASFGLMIKYTPLLQNSIANWEKELNTIPLDQCKKPPSSYYFNCAELIQEKVLNESDKEMAGVDRNKAKAELDIQDLVASVRRYFENIKTAVTNSPSGAYLDWDNVTFNGVKATDAWLKIYNRLRFLGYDNMARLLANNLMGHLRDHGTERLRQENPTRQQQQQWPKWPWGRK